MVFMRVGHDFSVFAGLSYQCWGQQFAYVQIFLVDPRIVDISVCSAFYLLGESGKLLTCGNKKMKV